MTESVQPSTKDPGHETQAFARSERVGYFAKVPFATIVATIGLVLATGVLYLLLSRTTKILNWMLIAAFFAVVLTPPVNWLVTRLRMPRSIAASLVFVIGFSCLGAMSYAFIRPLADEGRKFAKDFPTYVNDAQEGRGEIGKLVKKWKVDDWLEKNQDDLQKRAQNVFSPNKVLGTTVGALGSAFSIAAAILSTLVLTFLMLIQGHQVLTTATFLLAPHQRERIHNIGRNSAKAITGYVAGNLAISVIAGGSSFVFGLIANVPFVAVLALWVAFADLIPLVGATLGAIPFVIVAFLYTTPVGIAALIFFAIYQQFENQVLQPTIMAKTVALKPLMVLTSVLFRSRVVRNSRCPPGHSGCSDHQGDRGDIVAHRRPGWVEQEPERVPVRKLRRRSSDGGDNITSSDNTAGVKGSDSSGGGSDAVEQPARLP